MHRALSPTLRRKIVLQLATFAGRFTRSALRTGPGILGAGLVTYGVGAIWWPLAPIIGGLFLLIVDNRTGTPPRPSL